MKSTYITFFLSVSPSRLDPPILPLFPSYFLIYTLPSIIFLISHIISTHSYHFVHTIHWVIFLDAQTCVCFCVTDKLVLILQVENNTARRQEVERNAHTLSAFQAFSDTQAWDCCFGNMSNEISAVMKLEV